MGEISEGWEVAHTPELITHYGEVSSVRLDPMHREVKLTVNASARSDLELPLGTVGVRVSTKALGISGM